MWVRWPWTGGRLNTVSGGVNRRGNPGTPVLAHRIPGRHHAATLVDQISAAGARVIGFDILYPDADVSNPENDLRFAESVERAGNVIMGVHLDLKSTTGAQGEREELSPELQELVIEKQVYPAIRHRGTSRGGARIQGANLSMNRPELNRSAASFGSPPERRLP